MPLRNIPWSFTVGLLLISSGAWFGCVARINALEQVKDMNAEAVTAEIKKDYQTALSLYDAALRKVSHTEDAPSWLWWLQPSVERMRLRVATARAPLDHATLDRYRLEARSADPQTRCVALNNLGLDNLRKGELPQAIERFQEVYQQLNQLPEKQQFAYRYNFACVLEAAARFKEAHAEYQAAIGKPAFAPAVKGAFRVCRHLGTEGLNGTVELSTRLLEQGESTLVDPELWISVEVWNTDPNIRLLLDIVPVTIASANVDRGKLDAIDERFVRLRKVNPSLELPVKSLQRACRDSWALPRSEDDADRLFAGWTDTRARRAALSRLLKKVGDVMKREGPAADPRQVLTRYWTAWLIDGGNSEACLYAASLVRESGSSLDPDHALLIQMTETAFAQKVSWTSNPKATLDTRKNLVLLRTVLGKFYEQLNQWGPEDAQRSALYQWRHASLEAAFIKAQDPKFRPPAEIERHLALALVKNERKDEAVDHFLAAARQYSVELSPLDGKATLKQVQSIGLNLNEDQATRFQSLILQLKEQSPQDPEN